MWKKQKHLMTAHPIHMIVTNYMMRFLVINWIESKMDHSTTKLIHSGDSNANNSNLNFYHRMKNDTVPFESEALESSDIFN